MEIAANETPQRQCDGACEEHTGTVSAVFVQGWGEFHYCDAAVAEDRRRGLVVTNSLPDNAELCGGTSALSAVLCG